MSRPKGDILSPIPCQQEDESNEELQQKVFAVLRVTDRSVCSRFKSFQCENTTSYFLFIFKCTKPSIQVNNQIVTEKYGRFKLCRSAVLVGHECTIQKCCHAGQFCVQIVGKRLFPSTTKSSPRQAINGNSNSIASLRYLDLIPLQYGEDLFLLKLNTSFNFMAYS